MRARKMIADDETRPHRWKKIAEKNSKILTKTASKKF